MTNAQAAERLKKALECAKANKSCRIEEEALILAIVALSWVDTFFDDLDKKMKGVPDNDSKP